MASGNDFRICLSKETTYATRVAPARFFVITGESIAFDRVRAFSQALGMGRWPRPSVLTTRAGSGTIGGEVPTTNFGILLSALHGNTVTPVQQAATTAYLQTHNLDTAPDKSWSIQKQMPPVTSSTLVPLDYIGVVFTGITFAWTAGGLLTWSMDALVNDEITGQTLVTYVAPPAWAPFGFTMGAVTIGGTPEANIIGDGSITIGTSMRDNAFALGTTGTMAKPVETDKPTAEGTFTADFNDLTNVNRVVNNTTADVVLSFIGATIASTFKYTLSVTLKDCVFTTPSPTVNDPGPVQQTVNFTSAPSVNNYPIITYMSTDVTI